MLRIPCVMHTQLRYMNMYGREYLSPDLLNVKILAGNIVGRFRHDLRIESRVMVG